MKLRRTKMYLTPEPQNRFSKGYLRDAGVDIILDKDVIFEPFQITVVDLNVQLQIEGGEYAILCPRSSAAKQGLFIANCPIDPDYSGNVHAIVFNASKNRVKYKAGEAFCQYLVSVFIAHNVKPRKTGMRSTSKFGETGGTNGI